jgi:hypothetical protein
MRANNVTNEKGLMVKGFGRADVIRVFVAAAAGVSCVRVSCNPRYGVWLTSTRHSCRNQADLFFIKGRGRGDLCYPYRQCSFRVVLSIRSAPGDCVQSSDIPTRIHHPHYEYTNEDSKELLSSCVGANIEGQ